MKKILLSLSTLTLGLIAPLSMAAEQAWPEKPIKLMVPYPAGSATDTFARVFSIALAKELQQSVIVINRGGAGGSLGTAELARAKPDGYSVLISGVGTNAINYALYKDLSYSDKDFAHVTLLTTGPNVIAVATQSPLSSLEGIVDKAKTSPNALNFGSGGSGSSGHLAFEALKAAADVEILHVPYKGVNLALNDLMAGHIDMAIGNQNALLPLVQGGKLKPIAVTGRARNPVFPSVPTLAELGYGEATAESWMGLSFPAGTDTEIVERMNKAAIGALQSSDIHDRLLNDGYTVEGTTSTEFTAFVRKEIIKWAKAADASGVQAE